MKRHAAIVVLSVLAASGCSQRPVPPKISDGWTGAYRNDSARALITRRADGSYRFDISVSKNTPPCTGSGEDGTATLSADGQVLTADFDAPGHAECEIDLRHQGRTLVVSESEECGALHADQCPFNGRLLPEN